MLAAGRCTDYQLHLQALQVGGGGAQRNLTPRYSIWQPVNIPTLFGVSLLDIPFCTLSLPVTYLKQSSYYIILGGQLPLHTMSYSNHPPADTEPVTQVIFNLCHHQLIATDLKPADSILPTWLILPTLSLPVMTASVSDVQSLRAGTRHAGFTEVEPHDWVLGKCCHIFKINWFHLHHWIVGITIPHIRVGSSHIKQMLTICVLICGSQLTKFVLRRVLEI